MRASRLFMIVTLLQARGKVTAGELAETCEVGLRTIYRDIDALSLAGVPVYSDRGPEGGYRLLDGYRTQLNGLSGREAEALFLTGLAGPAADLGLGAIMAGAQNKLMAAIPARLREGAEQMRARFHLDASAWFDQREQPPHLQAVAAAVWSQNVIQIRYQSWKARQERRLNPLGLVLKGGAWYLVADLNGRVLTYRIARILDLQVLDQGFERPTDFDLARHWQASADRLANDLHANQAIVRLSPAGQKMLEVFITPFAGALTRLEDAVDAQGWRIAVIPVGSVRQATADILRFGSEIEVLAPPELRRNIVETIAAMASIYRSEDSVLGSEELLPADDRCGSG